MKPFAICISREGGRRFEYRLPGAQRLGIQKGGIVP